MYARVGFYDMGGASRDDAVRSFEDTQSTIEQIEGIRSGLMLISSDGDEALTITLWESEEALRASAQLAQQMRGQAAGSAGMTPREAKSYEVAIQFGL
jgi:heme-degrading monooxygenase HmoA